MATDTKTSAWATLTAEPVSVAGMDVTPEARRLRLGPTRLQLCWTRPVAVYVRQEGRQRRVPVIDVTRRLQIVSLALAAVAFVFGLRSGRQSPVHARQTSAGKQ